jgi:hypothetical protein
LSAAAYSIYSQSVYIWRPSSIRKPAVVLGKHHRSEGYTEWKV